MDLTWAFAGATLGAPLGALASTLVFRHAVPLDSPRRTRCPHCDAQLRRWWSAALRCGGCGGRLAAPLPVALITAAVTALVLGRFAGQWEALAFAFIGALGVTLATIDLSVRRLPHRLTLPAYPALIALFALAAVATNDAAAFGRSLLGGLALGGTYYLLAVVGRGQLGGGDVVLAGLLGIALGWLGWPELVIGAWLAFVLFAVVAAVLLATRRVTLRGHLPFGPFMLFGALLAATIL